MSNRFWGWGREDDEFFRRLKTADLQVKKSRKTNIFASEQEQIHLTFKSSLMCISSLIRIT